MAKHSILIGLMAVTASSCSSLNSTAPIADAVILTDAGNSLLNQCSRYSPPPGDGTWQPAWDDVRALEARLPEALAQQPEAAQMTGTPPDGWGRQFVGLTRNGRRYIYGNYFPENSMRTEDWRSRPAGVCDGGPDFFGVQYDVEARRIDHLAFNGLA